MGGAGRGAAEGREAFDAGDYRWAATLLNHVVFADPKNAEARELLARTYDQLGYQAECGVWRDVYLTGALELRHGAPRGRPRPPLAGDILARIPLDLFFAAMATRLNGPKAAEQDPITLNFVFTDLGESYVLTLENAVLHHRPRDATRAPPRR